MAAIGCDAVSVASWDRTSATSSARPLRTSKLASAAYIQTQAFRYNNTLTEQPGTYSKRPVGLENAQLRQLQRSRASSRNLLSREYEEADLIGKSLILLTHDHTAAYPPDCLTLTSDTCEHVRSTICAQLII